MKIQEMEQLLRTYHKLGREIVEFKRASDDGWILVHEATGTQLPVNAKVPVKEHIAKLESEMRKILEKLNVSE